MAATARGFRGSGGGFGARYEGVVVAGAARTPFGEFMATLAGVSPTDLGIVAARGALERSGIPASEVDQVIFANVAQSGPDAFYLPRHVGLYAGLKPSCPALLVQRICGSGFEAIIAGIEQIALGKAKVVLCGGSESMSRNPIASYGGRMGMAMGNPDFVDTLTAELLDPAPKATMGQTAENLAKQYGLLRDEVDEVAFRSQQRALAARDGGLLSEEITPVIACVLEAEGLAPRRVKLPKKVERLDLDEHPRNTNPEKLAALKPVFAADGVQTAGNSSGIVDGAAAVVLCDEETALKAGLAPLGRITASASVGVDPSVMGIGPVFAVRLLMEACSLKLDQLDLIEVNEAFGAQYLAVERELGLNPERTNVNGGAIALGHPLAATGTRLVSTLLYEMGRRASRMGLASACIGGGQGTAVLVERG
jgi:acetyl-CoA C-acetyltransferase